MADIAFSADGKTLISGGADRFVRFWSMRTGKLTNTVNLGQSAERHPFLEEATLSPDGKLLAAWEGEHVIVHDVSKGTQLQRIQTGYPSHKRLVFSPDGKSLATMSGVGGKYGIHLWDLATGKESATIEPKHFVQDLKFSPDGKSLGSLNSGDGLHLWDAATGKQKEFLLLEASRLTYRPDNESIATVTPDGSVILCDSSSLAKKVTLRATQRGDFRNASMAFSPDGKRLADRGRKTLWSGISRTSRKNGGFPGRT
jgi:WD40 repeat protein